MHQPNSHGRDVGEGYRYLALGGTFAAGIIGFMAAGYGIDRWLGVLPLFTLGGTVVGAVLSFLNVYWKLRGDMETRAGGTRGDRSEPH